MTIYPRTHADGTLKGKKDKRYTVALEYTGDLSGKARFVLRFCDKSMSATLQTYQPQR